MGKEKQLLGHFFLWVDGLHKAFAVWNVRCRAKASFGHIGRNISWSPQVEWSGAESIHVGDNCVIERGARLLVDRGNEGGLLLEENVVISENAVLHVQGGNIKIEKGSFLGENTRIIAIQGSVHIKSGVRIGRNTEVIAERGEVVIGEESIIDPYCVLRGNGVIEEGALNKGLLKLGPQNYVGRGTILEANGGYIKTESKVKIDYRNIIGGKGGVYLEERTHLRHDNYVDAFKEPIHFGEHVTLGQKCIIAGRGKIEIGATTLIGGLTFIVSENHRAKRFDVPYRYQGHDYEGINIERNVWIGGQSLILDGVTIGTGSLVGGGSVVVHNLEPWSFAVGVPARRLVDIREKEKQKGD